MPLVEQKLQQPNNSWCSAVCVMVEARGIEPLSENLFIQLSSSGVYLLKFPAHSADKQAERVGSFFIHDSFKSKKAVRVHRCVMPVPKPRYSSVGHRRT